MRRPFALLLLTLLAATAVPVRAQYVQFGQNRVQYGRPEWRYIQSAHLDVHFYERPGMVDTNPGGRVLADAAARAGEDALRDIYALTGYSPAHRIPVLVYQGHNSFAATNAVELPLHAEGIGGVTERYKNRVAVPFTGDWRAFRRVVRHELVHAVLNDVLYGGTLQTAIRNNLRLVLPDWFDEGLAEYVAFGWDSESDLWLRDAVLGGYLPPVNRLGGFFAYRGGQGFWDFLAGEYGREKVGDVMEALRYGRSVQGAFYTATGLTIEELSERWHAALRESYFPEATAREPLDVVGRAIPEPPDAYWVAGPALSPGGDLIAYVAAGPGRFDVYVADAQGAQTPRLVIGSAGNPDFERFRLLSPGLAWDPTGRRLAVATTSGPSDVLAVVDVATGQSRPYRLPSLDAVQAVAWSPDGATVAVEGVAGAASDLYLLSLETSGVVNLTDDLFSDHAPAWTSDGRALLFHSDRGPHTGPDRPRAVDAAQRRFDVLAHVEGPEGRQFDLYRLSLDTRVITRLTETPWDETSPAAAGTRGVLYVSDRNGVANAYSLLLGLDGLPERPGPGSNAAVDSMAADTAGLATADTTGGLTPTDARPLTDLQAGILGLSTTPDGRRAAVLALDQGMPAVYVIRNPLSRETDVPARLAPTVWARRAELADDGPAPALTLASEATRHRNPFLRDAVDGRPYTFVPPPWVPPVMDPAMVDSLMAAYGMGGGPLPDSLGGPDSSLVVGYAPREGGVFRPRDAYNPDGTYRVRRYRLRFSPDLVSAAGSYDTVFGVQAVTQVMFSDLLGDHRFRFATNLVLDLRNADYLLAYESRGGRTDLALQAFHLARELVDDTVGTVYRYRNYGAVAGLRYPLDTFRRLEGDVAVLGVALADLSDLASRPSTRRFVYPRLAYVVDRTSPGRLAPADGGRWALQLAGSPGPSVNFLTGLIDGRQYIPLARAGGRSRYTLALRGSAGLSVGPDPQRFYAGGVASWLNPTYQSLPIRDPDDFLLATPVLPLRGFGFNEAAGDRFLLVNAEIRAPLVAAFLPGPIPILPFYDLQAVGFVDAGVISQGRLSVWRDGTDGAGNPRRVLDDVLLGVGGGLRTVVIGYPLRADWAWPFDGRFFGKPRFLLSVGLDF